MSPNPVVFVCGPTFLDVVMAGLPGAPQLGKEMWVDNSQVSAGGAANQAVALARLGIHTELVTTLGTDRAGRIVREILSEQGVRTTYSEDVDQQSLTVSLAWGGDRAMVTHGTDKAGKLPDIEAPAVLIADLKAIRDNEEVVKKWRKGGTKVIGDVGWDDSGAWRIEDLEPVQHCDYFVPNETELLHYARTFDLRQAFTTLDELVDTDATIILTRGSRGVMVVSDSNWKLPALEVDVVDPTGAGDAFSAGLAAGIAMELPLKNAVSFAQILAGLSLTKPGGAGSTPTLEEMSIQLDSHTLPDVYGMRGVKKLIDALAQ